MALLHGQKLGMEKVVESFKLSFPEVSKSLVIRTIKDIATKEKGSDGSGSYKWVVKDSVASELMIEVISHSIYNTLYSYCFSYLAFLTLLLNRNRKNVGLVS